MNDRIQQLAEQAGLQLGIVLENSTTPVKTITVEQRKFAELIIRECASIVDNYGRWILYDKLAVKIKKRFWS